MAKKPYEMHVLRHMGLLHELTLRDKLLAPVPDGDYLNPGYHPLRRG